MSAINYTQDTALCHRPSTRTAPWGGWATLKAGVAPAWWLAAAVLTTTVLRLAGGAGAEAAVAVAGTASLVYLGTAIVSGRLATAALDITAAVTGAALAAGGEAAPTVMMVHVPWGALRGWTNAAAPGRRFAAGWSVFFGAQALLLGLSG